MTLLTIVEAGVPILAFVMMIAVGLDVTPADMRSVAAQRSLITVATAGQVFLLPAIALLIVGALPERSAVADYLLLIAAAPGGGLSNVYVYLARANTAMSVSLTAVSCLGAVLTMPLVTAAYAVILGRPMAFRLPYVTLIGQLLVLAVIPVILGVWVRHRYPDIERKFGSMVRGFCMFGVVFIVLVGLLQSRATIDVTVLIGGVAAAALVSCGMVVGWLVGWLTRAGLADRFTLLIEFAVRNLAIALVIEVTLLHNTDFVAFAALAAVAQAVLLLSAVRVYQQLGPGELVRPVR